MGKEYWCSLYPWYEQCETLNQIFFLVPDLVVMNIQRDITHLHRIWVLDYNQQIFIFCLKKEENRKNTLNLCIFLWQGVHTKISRVRSAWLITQMCKIVNMLSIKLKSTLYSVFNFETSERNVHNYFIKKWNHLSSDILFQ